MRHLVARLIGAVFLLLGGALLVHLGRLFASHRAPWLEVAAGLDLPTIILLTMVAVAASVIGLALLLQWDPPLDSPANSKFGHVRSPSRRRNRP